MPIQEVDTIWMDGKLRPWREATVHVLSHALHYGTSFFEGMRVYESPGGPCAFRINDHIERLFDSAAIYGCQLPYSREEIIAACDAVIAENNLVSAYVRPIVFYGYGELSVAPGPTPVQVAVAAFPWGAYLGEAGRTQGVDVCVSSWNRAAPNTIPAAAKAGGNYLSGVLISSEAKARGFAEGIALDVNGLVSEGAGENLFLVRKGKLFTPPSAASILNGITRDTVISLARAEGLEIVEQAITREALYLADEMFLTGTAAEITPVRSVDGKRLKSDGRGPITALLQTRFFGLFDGSTPDREGWLHLVRSKTIESAKHERAVAV